MEEMSEQDRQTRDAKFARRKRIAESVMRVIQLLVAAFWLLVFATVARTGYLSRIALTVGAIFVLSLGLSLALDWAGRKRLGLILLGVHIGMFVLCPVAMAAALLWPHGNGTWRPYRFDDELAAIEAKRAVPDAENAAPRYEAVFRQTDETDEPNCLFIAATSLRGEFERQPWKGSDYPEASAWLDSRSPAIDALLEIGRMEKCRWPVQADRYDKYTVPYKNLRHCALLLLAAGNRDLGEGRLTDALTKYFCTLRIADHIRQQPSKVDCFTGFGREENGLRIIRDLLAQYKLSEEDVARIAAHLPPAADLWPQEWERLVEFEKLQYMNFLGRLYERDDRGHVRFATSPALSAPDEQEPKVNRGTGRLPGLFWLMTMPHDPHAVRGVADRYFARIELIVNSKPLPRVGTNERRPRASQSDLAKAMCNSLRWCAETFFFGENEYVEHRQRRTAYVTARRGTWLVLGLRRYRNGHGAWPQTLAAISEYVPAEALVDPTNGEAFVYVPDGESFQLYSKGFNRIDDGGRSGYVRASKKVEDDIWIWPPPPEPAEDESMDDEMLKQMEQIYGKEYFEILMKKDKGSDKQ
jgi:hypothetical protein